MGGGGRKSRARRAKQSSSISNETPTDTNSTALRNALQAEHIFASNERNVCIGCSTCSSKKKQSASVIKSTKAGSSTSSSSVSAASTSAPAAVNANASTLPQNQFISPYDNLPQSTYANIDSSVHNRNTSHSQQRTQDEDDEVEEDVDDDDELDGMPDLVPESDSSEEYDRHHQSNQQGSASVITQGQSQKRKASETISDVTARGASAGTTEIFSGDMNAMMSSERIDEAMNDESLFGDVLYYKVLQLHENEKFKGKHAEAAELLQQLTSLTQRREKQEALLQVHKTKVAKLQKLDQIHREIFDIARKVAKWLASPSPNANADAAAGTSESMVYTAADILQEEDIAKKNEVKAKIFRKAAQDNKLAQVKELDDKLTARKRQLSKGVTEFAELQQILRQQQNQIASAHAMALRSASAAAGQPGNETETCDEDCIECTQLAVMELRRRADAAAKDAASKSGSDLSSSDLKPAVADTLLSDPASSSPGAKFPKNANNQQQPAQVLMLPFNNEEDLSSILSKWLEEESRKVELYEKTRKQTFDEINRVDMELSGAEMELQKSISNAYSLAMKHSADSGAFQPQLEEKLGIGADISAEQREAFRSMTFNDSEDLLKKYDDLKTHAKFLQVANEILTPRVNSSNAGAHQDPVAALQDRISSIIPRFDNADNASTIQMKFESQGIEFAPYDYSAPTGSKPVVNQVSSSNSRSLNRGGVSNRSKTSSKHHHQHHAHHHHHKSRRAATSSSSSGAAVFAGRLPGEDSFYSPAGERAGGSSLPPPPNSAGDVAHHAGGFSPDYYESGSESVHSGDSECSHGDGSHTESISSVEPDGEAPKQLCCPLLSVVSRDNGKLKVLVDWSESFVKMSEMDTEVSEFLIEAGFHSGKKSINSVRNHISGGFLQKAEISVVIPDEDDDLEVRVQAKNLWGRAPPSEMRSISVEGMRSRKRRIQEEKAAAERKARDLESQKLAELLEVLKSVRESEEGRRGTITADQKKKLNASIESLSKIHSEMKIKAVNAASKAIKESRKLIQESREAEEAQAKLQDFQKRLDALTLSTAFEDPTSRALQRPSSTPEEAEAVFAEAEVTATAVCLEWQELLAEAAEQNSNSEVADLFREKFFSSLGSAALSCRAPPRALNGLLDLAEMQPSLFPGSTLDELKNLKASYRRAREKWIKTKEQLLTDRRTDLERKSMTASEKKKKKREAAAAAAASASEKASAKTAAPVAVKAQAGAADVATKSSATGAVAFRNAVTAVPAKKPSAAGASSAKGDDSFLAVSRKGTAAASAPSPRTEWPAPGSTSIVKIGTTADLSGDDASKSRELYMEGDYPVIEEEYLSLLETEASRVMQATDQDAEKRCELVDAVRAGETNTKKFYKNGSFTFETDDTEKRPLESLIVGGRYIGRVVGIAKFGIFVDIGCEKPGLVHISQIREGFIANVNDEVKMLEQVNVRVASLSIEKKNFSCTMRENVEIPGDLTDGTGDIPEPPPKEVAPEPPVSLVRSSPKRVPISSPAVAQPVQNAWDKSSLSIRKVAVPISPAATASAAKEQQRQASPHPPKQTEAWPSLPTSASQGGSKPAAVPEPEPEQDSGFLPLSVAQSAFGFSANDAFDSVLDYSSGSAFSAAPQRSTESLSSGMPFELPTMRNPAISSEYARFQQNVSQHQQQSQQFAMEGQRISSPFGWNAAFGDRERAAASQNAFSANPPARSSTSNPAEYGQTQQFNPFYRDVFGSAESAATMSPSALQKQSNDRAFSAISAFNSGPSSSESDLFSQPQMSSGFGPFATIPGQDMNRSQSESAQHAYMSRLGGFPGQIGMTSDVERNSNMYGHFGFGASGLSGYSGSGMRSIPSPNPIGPTAYSVFGAVGNTQDSNHNRQYNQPDARTHSTQQAPAYGFNMSGSASTANQNQSELESPFDDAILSSILN